MQKNLTIKEKNLRKDVITKPRLKYNTSVIIKTTDIYCTTLFIFIFLKLMTSLQAQHFQICINHLQPCTCLTDVFNLFL